MHMLLILLALCLRRPNGISHLFSIAYAFAGNGWDYRIQLAGHTDNQGSERKNQALSERRVQSIKAYLTQRFHIAPERVQAVGYGPTRPIMPNDTPEGRAKNRRVEVVSLGRAQ